MSNNPPESSQYESNGIPTCSTEGPPPAGYLAYAPQEPSFRMDSTKKMLATNQWESTRINGAGVVADQSGAVKSFFESIRVVSTFLAGICFSEFFGANYDQDDSAIQHGLQVMCLLCQGFSSAFSMIVIVMSTSACVRALTADFDSFAESGYEFLFREFHYEFVCVRWCFDMSLFGFLLAVTGRVLYTFELFNVHSEDFDRSRLELGIAVCLLMTSLMVHMFAYINSTLIGWDSLVDMTWDMLKMVVKRGSLEKPMEPISLVIFGVGMVFLLLAFIPGAQI